MSSAPDAGCLLGDPGVLAAQSTLEWGAHQAVARCGGLAIFHWRADFLAAQAQGVCCQASTDPLSGQWPQVVVAATRDREATIADCLQACQHTAVGGRFLLYGQHSVGIKTTAQRVAERLGQAPETLVARAHARVLAWVKSTEWAVAQMPPIHWRSPSGLTLQAMPGVFTAGRVDEGSALLWSCLAEWGQRHPAPQRMVDLGCGSGVLALEAARHWPQAQLVAADADARAVASAAANAASNGMAERMQVQWWDSAEPPPLHNASLVLCNPPWHHRGAVDRGPGLRMCHALGQALSKDGHALIVATKTQPFEATLATYGSLRTLTEQGGYKVLELSRAG